MSSIRRRFTLPPEALHLLASLTFRNVEFLLAPGKLLLKGDPMPDAGWPSRRHVMVGSALLGLHMAGGAAATTVMASGYVYEDRQGLGRRQAGDRGIPNVLVSNGTDVVRTNADGQWQLPATAGSQVFVIKPPQWRLPSGALGLNRFSRCVPMHAGNASADSRHDMPSIDFALERSPEAAEFEAVLVADTQPQSDLELEYLRGTILAAVADTGARFAINHGDVVFDDLTLYPRYLQLVAATGMPWHHCPGNHDMNFIDTPATDCFETWQAVFGPTYYAFQHGQATFILLNNVERLPHGQLTSTGHNYRGGIGAKQLRFVRNLLAHLPADQLIVLSMHIPLIGFEDPNDPHSIGACTFFRLISMR